MEYRCEFEIIVRQTSRSSDQGQIEIAFAPLPLGGAGGGAQLTAKRKANYLSCAGFQPRAGSFLRYRLRCAPPLTPPKGRGISSHSLHDLKIHPLRSCAVFLVSIQIGDDHLEGVISGSQISSQLNLPAGN